MNVEFVVVVGLSLLVNLLGNHIVQNININRNVNLIKSNNNIYNRRILLVGIW